MISQIYRSLLSFSLISLFSFTLIFGFAMENSWAATPFSQLINPSTPAIASIERVNAATKDLEGKAQEALGNVTGDRKNEIAGKAKQTEANVRNAAQDIKDNVKLPDRVQSFNKNIEGKTQEAIGKVTGDRKDQLAGKGKQVESKTRNLLEDAKDAIKGIFE
jgi:uncharacterized protein YjbJ (UPF0337 family)